MAVQLLMSMFGDDLIDVKAFIERVDPSIRDSIFPNRAVFIESNDFRSLIKEGISNDVFNKPIKYKKYVYKSLKNGYLWHNIMNAFGNLKKYDDGMFIVRELLEKGVSDSSTLNDCSALILNRILLHKKILPCDNDDFELAKKMLYKAFIFDSQGNVKKNIIVASDAPAYKNLVLVRSIEAQRELGAGKLFNAYVLGWISVEMSLIRIWCHLLAQKELTKVEKLNLPRWDISKIIDVLYVRGVIDKKMQTDLHDHRGRRNRLIHGEILNPSKGQILNLVKIAEQLIFIFNPINPLAT